MTNALTAEKAMKTKDYDAAREAYIAARYPGLIDLDADEPLAPPPTPEPPKEVPMFVLTLEHFDSLRNVSLCVAEYFKEVLDQVIEVPEL
jgi:hypothetical protein